MSGLMPWLCGGTGLHVGRKLKDCEDGLILTIASVDSDGDYCVVDEQGNDEGFVLPYECHDGGAHRPCLWVDCPDFGKQSTCCYEWIEPPAGL